ncbi:probable DNA-directed RNA polymerase III subunit RPC6 [Cimex lectularius]|uniref:DNA-directed RNA polymerase III subunit RPC6 n=1 Tax=Cimex lectularius TaxID=79782 RepID=A0A8I6S8I8_CIMLE|nr:probable DNA-directed RNA polymerase III subunit RPC6 [Cimex lectularius]
MSVKKASTSKAPESDPNEQIILSIAAAAGTKGCFDEDIVKTLPNLPGEQRVACINRLIAKRLLDVYQIGNKIAYKARTPDSDPADLKGADNEEKIVYEIVKEAGNKGIWMRDIRLKSNLQPTVLNKILKSLENKKIIKAVKSVTAYKKKVYMLFELEPDSTLTGGSWYSDQDFESEFVDVLNQQCYRYLIEIKQKYEMDPSNVKKGPVAFYNQISVHPKQVCKFISDLGISKIPLSEEDIKTILDTLLYDGKVERRVTLNGDYTYRAVNSIVDSPGLVSLPCGVCPVIKECNDNGVVSPFMCPYLTTWGKKSLVKMQAPEDF